MQAARHRPASRHPPHTSNALHGSTAKTSLRQAALPLGLAHQVVLRNSRAAGEVVRWDDVDVDETLAAVRLRREMEALFAPDLHLDALTT